MKFIPLNDKQIDDLNPPIQLGTVSLEIIKAEDAQTRDGKNKISLRMSAMDSSGATGIVFDDLLDPEAYEGKGKSYVIRKIKAFCEAFSINYESGMLLPSTLVGKIGKGAVDKNDKDYLEVKFYQPKESNKPSSISDTISKHEQELPPTHTSAPEEFNDDIPF